MIIGDLKMIAFLVRLQMRH